MRTKNILCAILVSVFAFGALTVNAQEKVYVHKTDNSADVYTIDEIDSISFTAPEIDYSNLKLNEVSGVGSDAAKFYELINIGAVDIPLEGCEIYYNANGETGGDFPPTDERLTWTGEDGQIARAGKLFSLIGRDEPGSFTTGLTPERILIITLKDPEGNTIDELVRAQDIGAYAGIRDYSMARIPDGTGNFYFTLPTPDALNGGFLAVPAEPIVEADYSGLILNEIDGNSKAIELYNAGEIAIPLTGVTLWKNDGESAWWRGSAESGSIEPGGYVLIIQSGPAGFSGGSGISPKQLLKFELKDPTEESLGIFQRGDSGFGEGADDVAPNSFQRIPNATGGWKQAVPTNGAANAESGTDIPNM